jgi:hypothetical protein
MTKERLDRALGRFFRPAKKAKGILGRNLGQAFLAKLS